MCVCVCVCFRDRSFHVLPIISIWQKIRLLGVACKDPNGALLQDFKNGLMATLKALGLVVSEMKFLYFQLNVYGSQ